MSCSVDVSINDFVLDEYYGIDFHFWNAGAQVV